MPTPRPNTRQTTQGQCQSHVLAWLSAFVLLAVYLRMGDPAWGYHYTSDEMLHRDIAQGATLKQVLHYALYEANPPFGHILRHYWIKISDTSAFGRVLSLLFGLALIPLYYRIGSQAAGSYSGLYTALLASFSYGISVQSVEVRVYSVFLFFLSLCFYCYQLWRQHPSCVLLILYALCGLMACMTHFYGIFAIVVIILYEALSFWKKRCAYPVAGWFLANSAIILPMAAGYALVWHKTLKQMNFIELSTPQLVLQMVLYPLLTLAYILPHYTIALACLFGLPFLLSYRNAVLRPYLHLLLIGFAVGMALTLLGYYPHTSRHTMWLLPFILPFLGALLNDFCQWLQATFFPHTPRFRSLYTTFLCVLGLALHQPLDNSMRLSESQWKEATDYLRSLDANHLIITARWEVFILQLPGQNPYYYFDLFNEHYANVKVSPDFALMPYGSTHLMFITAYASYGITEITHFLHQSPMTHNITTLVFVLTPEPPSSVMDLLSCTALDKKITAFPFSPSADPQTHSLVVLAIDKQAFLDQVLSPHGKAHHCLNK